MDNFIVREFRESDRDYITRTMLYSHFSLSNHAKRINKDSYMNGQNKIINSLLDYAKTLVVADPIDSDLIYAFIVYEQGLGQFDVIHYAHVRKDFRKLGLLKNLVEVVKTRSSLAISHINDEIKPAKLKKFYEKVIYDPYLQGNKNETT